MVSFFSLKRPLFFGLSLLLATTAHARIWVVDQQHPAATDEGPGSPAVPFRTIAPAAAAAMPGDTVQVHAGHYRERVIPARSGSREDPIRYTAAPNETVILSASDIWTPDWQPVVEGEPRIRMGNLDAALFRSPHHNPYREALRGAVEDGYTCGQVFLDGQALTEVNSRDRLLRTPATWWYDAEAGAVAIHFPDEARAISAYTVELTTRTRNFAPEIRGTSWIQVNGFIMEHAGNQVPVGFYVPKEDTDELNPAQQGALGLRGGIGWRVTHNTIRYAKATGIDIGWEGYKDEDYRDQPPTRTQGLHVIEGNVIEHNGSAGIIGLGSYGTVIRNNVIQHNARLGLGGTETSGIKVHFFVGGLIEGNLIRGNDTSGIWIDNVWRDSRITRNVIVDNAETGIFVEMGVGPVLIDNNIIAHTRPMGMPGDGVYSHEASGVTLVHNLIFGNANFGVWWHVGGARHVPLPRFTVAVDAIESPDQPRPWVDRQTGERAYPPGKWQQMKEVKGGASDWDVRNNIILANGRGAISAPHPFEADNGNHSRNNHSDYNLLAGNMDLVTSETWAAALDEPLFIWNTNKMRVDRETIADRLFAWFEANDIPETERPGRARWLRQPWFRLDEWRGVTAHDRNSAYGLVLRPRLSASGLWFTAVFDETLETMGCPPIDGVTTDFYGKPIDPERVLPGPFQAVKLTRGMRDNPAPAEFRGPYNFGDDAVSTNVFPLWPLEQPSGAEE
ncbi:MAG: right-handed parallel beta-helix repeat-containing protein [Opitutales bacterium]